MAAQQPATLARIAGSGMGVIQPAKGLLLLQSLIQSHVLTPPQARHWPSDQLANLLQKVAAKSADES